MLILGDGGASVTVQSVVRDMGAKEIVVASLFTETNYDHLDPHFDSDVIINATPVGMYPNNLECLVELDNFKNLSGVADVIYNPERTKLILEAEKRNINCISGLYMLSAQGKKAAEYFFNKEIDDIIVDKTVKKLSFDLTNIILVGMPGCGKTSVGDVLARHYKRKLVDTDELIVERAGMSIPEIFEKEGEKGFREIEKQVIRDVGKEKGLIIATGGGAVTIKENHDALRQNGTVIFINRDTDALSKEGRPLSLANDLHEMYDKRLPMYRSISHYEIEVTGSIRDTAAKIIKIFE